LVVLLPVDLFFVGFLLLLLLILGRWGGVGVVLQLLAFLPKIVLQELLLVAFEYFLFLDEPIAILFNNFLNDCLFNLATFQIVVDFLIGVPVWVRGTGLQFEVTAGVVQGLHVLFSVEDHIFVEVFVGVLLGGLRLGSEELGVGGDQLRHVRRGVREGVVRLQDRPQRLPRTVRPLRVDFLVPSAASRLPLPLSLLSRIARRALIQILIPHKYFLRLHKYNNRQ
jgi:hypothetical protein